MAAQRSQPGATRLERDLLGELPVPADALYGIRTVRALRNLSFSGRSLGAYPAYVKALAVVKKAAARANRAAAVLDERAASAIVHACDVLLRGEHLDQFPVDPLGGGGGVAVNMNVNEVIANLANEFLGGMRGSYDPIDPKAHVNASQSTADVCHTATRMALVERMAVLDCVLDECVAAMRQQAVRLLPVRTLSRTCLQDGIATSLGDLFGGYAAALERRVAAVRTSALRLRQTNLGGTVIGSGDGAPAAYQRVILDQLNDIAGHQPQLRENLYDAAQNIDDLGEVSSQLALLAEVLIKVAQDLRLLASGPEGGFAEITLPAVQEGSSFFAGKINPVVPETLLHCCLQVLGCDRAVHQALERGELNLNVFEAVAGVNLFDAVEMLVRAVRLFVERCLTGITANAARCEALAARARTV